jgi:hypothetical protein
LDPCDYLNPLPFSFWNFGCTIYDPNQDLFLDPCNYPNPLPFFFWNCSCTIKWCWSGSNSMPGARGLLHSNSGSAPICSRWLPYQFNAFITLHTVLVQLVLVKTTCVK